MWIYYKKIKPICTFREELEYIKLIEERHAPWFMGIGDQANFKIVRSRIVDPFGFANLKYFPDIANRVSEKIPEAIIEHSYVSRTMPFKELERHVDKNRKAAIIVPLGPYKGSITYYPFDKYTHSHNYTGPVLSRVDVPHSVQNNSDSIRYSLTIEIPGSYWKNLFKY
jgi:hypothetical protein